MQVRRFGLSIGGDNTNNSTPFTTYYAFVFIYYIDYNSIKYLELLESFAANFVYSINLNCMFLDCYEENMQTQHKKYLDLGIDSRTLLK